MWKYRYWHVWILKKYWHWRRGDTAKVLIQEKIDTLDTWKILTVFKHGYFLSINTFNGWIFFKYQSINTFEASKISIRYQNYSYFWSIKTIDTFQVSKVPILFQVSKLSILEKCCSVISIDTSHVQILKRVDIWKVLILMLPVKHWYFWYLWSIDTWNEWVRLIHKKYLYLKSIDTS